MNRALIGTTGRITAARDIMRRLGSELQVRKWLPQHWHLSQDQGVVEFCGSDRDGVEERRLRLSYRRGFNLPGGGLQSQPVEAVGLACGRVSD
jgi:hypothetical protein